MALRGLIKRRAFMAAVHSWRGLKACFEHEEAFRVEVRGDRVFVDPTPSHEHPIA